MDVVIRPRSCVAVQLGYSFAGGCPVGATRLR